MATATAFTAHTLRMAWERFVQPTLPPVPTDFIVAGGGAYNPTLMRAITAELAPFRLRTSTSDPFGLPAAAKEAVAFALLAYQSWHRLPGNLPVATGAARPAVLGKISCP